MKRDMELVRRLLMRAESGMEAADISGYEEEAILYHVALMADAGLIQASMTPEIGIPEQAVTLRLTWAGHDFLDSTRDNRIWEMAKTHILKSGASWTFEILKEFLKQEMVKRGFLGAGPPP